MMTTEDRAIDDRAITQTGAAVRLPGTAVSAGWGHGPVRMVQNAAEVRAGQPGEVFVAATLTIELAVAIPSGCALVAERGGPLCSAAIVLRERRIPAVVLPLAASILADGDIVEIDGATGSVTSRTAVRSS